MTDPMNLATMRGSSPEACGINRVELAMADNDCCEYLTKHGQAHMGNIDFSVF